MLNNFLTVERILSGISFEQFFNNLKEKVETLPPKQLNVDENHLKLNYHRSQRIIKTYTVDTELAGLINEIKERQIWMVITEDWCGDSAQLLPYLAKMAASNPLIEFKIIYRDENLEIMDLYLTNGKSRSIPKLIAFDKNGNELFQWGPRPREAQDLVNQLKAEGFTKDQFIEQLHLWYGRNRGKAVEFEFKNILRELAKR